jgi:hypothetical protein
VAAMMRLMRSYAFSLLDVMRIPFALVLSESLGTIEAPNRQKV